MTFTVLDKNGDGFVSASELKRGTRWAEGDMGPLAFYDSDALCEAMIAMADTDNDGKISLAEFEELGGVLQEVAALKAEVRAASILAGEKA